MADGNLSESLVHLRTTTVSVVVDVGGGVPVVAHWGAPLGSGAVPGVLFQRAIPRGALDVVAPLSLVPEHGSGFPGRPGLTVRAGDGAELAECSKAGQQSWTVDAEIGQIAGHAERGRHGSMIRRGLRNVNESSVLVIVHG